MKVYRVTPDKRKQMTVYSILSTVGFIAAIALIALMFYCTKNNIEILVNENTTIKAHTLLLIVTAIIVIAACSMNSRASTEKYARCANVYIKDDSNHLYYLTLNKNAFDLKPSFVTMITLNLVSRRGANRYHAQELNAWNKYCAFMCRDDIADQLPAILKGERSSDSEAAILAFKIREITDVSEIKGGIKFSFYADGDNKMHTGGVYDYMNDYEELIELIKSKKA